MVDVDLKMGGFIPTTTVDYPGHLAAVIFTRGCPWRCRYCHNHHLIETGGTAHAWKDVFALLERRRHLLDGVVISGGEPLVQPALEDAIRALKALGYAIALHTSGVDPQRLARVLPLVDWIGLDIKGRAEDYPAITGVKGSAEKAFASLDLVLAAGIPYEVRTTVHWGLLTVEALEVLAQSLADRGVTHYRVQLAQPDSMLDETLGRAVVPDRVDALWQKMHTLFDHFEVRA